MTTQPAMTAAALAAFHFGVAVSLGPVTGSSSADLFTCLHEQYSMMQDRSEDIWDADEDAGYLAQCEAEDAFHALAAAHPQGWASNLPAPQSSFV